MSAINFMPKTGFVPTGGLGGAIEGMKTSMGLNQFDQEMEQMNLANILSKFKLGQEVEDERTWRGSDREAKRNEREYTIEDIRTGKRRAKDDANLDQTIESTRTNRRSRERADEDHSSTMASRAEGVADQLFMANPNGFKDPFTWAKIRQQAGAQGLPLPEDPELAFQLVRQLAQNARFSPERQKEDRKFTEDWAKLEFQQNAQTERAEISARNRVEAKAALFSDPRNAQHARVRRILEDKTLTAEQKDKMLDIIIEQTSREGVGDKLRVLPGDRGTPSFSERMSGAKGKSPGSAGGVSEIPTKKEEMKIGTTYNTPKGPRVFLGFTPDGQLRMKAPD